MGNGSPEARRGRGAEDDVGVNVDVDEGERDGATGAAWLPKTAVLGPPR